MTSTEYPCTLKVYYSIVGRRIQFGIKPISEFPTHDSTLVLVGELPCQCLYVNAMYFDRLYRKIELYCRGYHISCRPNLANSYCGEVDLSTYPDDDVIIIYDHMRNIMILIDEFVAVESATDADLKRRSSC